VNSYKPTEHLMKLVRKGNSNKWKQQFDCNSLQIWQFWNSRS